MLAAHVCHVLNCVQLPVRIHYLLLLWSRTHVRIVFLLELDGVRHRAANSRLDGLLGLLVLDLSVNWHVLLLLVQQKGLERRLLTI